MAETCQAGRTIEHQSEESTALRLRLLGLDGAVYRESVQKAVCQITVQSKTTAGRLILHVVP
jgi:hypothetical protein